MAVALIVGAVFALTPLEYNLKLRPGTYLQEASGLSVRRESQTLFLRWKGKNETLSIPRGASVQLLRRRNYSAVAIDGRIEFLFPTKAPLSNESIKTNDQILRIKGFYLAEDFSEVSPMLQFKGSWRVEAPIDDLVYRDHGEEGPPMYTFLTPESEGSPMCILGYPFWDNYLASVTVIPGRSESAGLLFNYRDESNYGAFVLKPKNHEVLLFLHERRGDRQSKVRIGKLPQPSVQQWYGISVQTTPGGVILYVNGERVGSAELGLAPHFGQAGLVAIQPKECFFDDIKVRRLFGFYDRSGTGIYWSLSTSPCRLEPRFSLREPWELELLLSGGRSEVRVPPWSVPIPSGRHRVVVSRKDNLTEVKIDGEAVKEALIGRGVLPTLFSTKRLVLKEFYARELPDGDTVLFDLTDVNSPLYQHYRNPLGKLFVPTGHWALLENKLHASAPGTLEFAETLPRDFFLTAEAELLPDARLRFRLGGMVAEVTSQKVLLAKGGRRLEANLSDGIELSRVGGFAGRLLLEPLYALPAKGADGKLLIQSLGGRINLASFVLSSPSAQTFSFRGLEPGWYIDGGKWTVHSGLACIAWDHWMTAEGNPRAMLWYQERLRGDFVFGLHISESSKGYADGSHFHFPYHDIYVAVCSDSKDPLDGYGFIIAGDGGSRTQLYRRGKLIKQTSEFTITKPGHSNRPREIIVRIIKKGAQIELIVNGSVLLDYKDPRPLDGGRIGFGVANCRANFKDVFFYPL